MIQKAKIDSKNKHNHNYCKYYIIGLITKVELEEDA